MNPRRRAILALALLVPAPSIGTLAAMVLFPGTALGKGLFAASKLWLASLVLSMVKAPEISNRDWKVVP